jgi:hypothetical protein
MYVYEGTPFKVRPGEGMVEGLSMALEWHVS